MANLRNTAACLSAMILAACSGAPMSAADARAALRDFRDHGERVCEADGLADFRRAARAYARAQRAEGQLWPSAAALSGDSDTEAPDLELMVIGAMAFGLLTPGDLGGDAARIKRNLQENMPAGFALADINIRGHAACAEAFSAFEDVTRFNLDAARIASQMRRASRDGDGERMQELYERRSRLMRNYERRLRDLREALERVRV